MSLSHILFAMKDSEGIKLTQNSVPTVQKRNPPPDSTLTVTASATKHVCGIVDIALHNILCACT